jgi:hypothetical protein
MKAKVGETAGRVWETLKNKEKVEISALAKILKEKTVVVYQAVGWLAREDKISYHIRGNKIYISLSASEKK